MRRAALVCACLLAWGTGASACFVDQAQLSEFPDSVVVDPSTDGAIARAWFDDPVGRYDHGVLGRSQEPSTLWVNAPGNHGLCGHALTLDGMHVFEDVAPRLADLDGDGSDEVIVVRTHIGKGAQLAVYRWTGEDLVLDAATPYIGRPHPWLAPVGVADLDGDGKVEIAYIDRPHLAKVLRVWRYEGGRLTEVAAAAGLSNHRIGDAVISGGIRDCGQGPEMVLPDGDWRRMVAVRLTGGRLAARDLGAYAGSTGLRQAMACRAG